MIKYFWSIDVTLKDTTSPGHSGPDSNGNCRINKRTIEGNNTQQQ